MIYFKFTKKKVTQGRGAGRGEGGGGGHTWASGGL